MVNYNIPKGNWNPVEGYSNYLISDDGRVFSLTSNRLLTIQTRKDGYKVIILWKDNKGKNKYIHRLVLKHFGSAGRNETVNHIDGDKGNNHISNLEWMSYSDNNKHARDTGLWVNNKNNPKMSKQVEKRCLKGNLIKTYPSIRQAERETGITASDISKGIKKGWNYGGYRWFLKGQYKGKASD